MEKLLDILRELHPETDFETETRLVDGGVLSSFDIVMLITRIEEEFDVVIPARDIVPEHFNSAKALYTLIEKISEQDD
ncbi:MAG: acyl carrier protein [Clostridia bacterium]|nr:acyl carrier protein [Clostridia bacterium]